MDPFTVVGHIQDMDVDVNGNLKTTTFGAGNKPVFLMLYGTGCGHCDKAKPAFAQVFKDQQQQRVFMAALKTNDDDPSVQKLMKRFPALLQKAGIIFNGVPTYLVFHNNKWREYKGGRDAESLRLFLRSI
jgi:thiol-disulfide isomerase/thioredoxin